jgi:hypothetical protein
MGGLVRAKARHPPLGTEDSDDPVHQDRIVILWCYDESGPGVGQGCRSTCSLRMMGMPFGLRWC